MGILSAKERNALPTEAFAIPQGRRYPIHNIEHARDALSRVSEFGTPQEKALVHAAVHHRYPQIGKKSDAKMETHADRKSEPTGEPKD